ncbi:MAG: hypothetical protein FD149_1019 [Rhodospirillaceae bacterium]|nr:MAG: hypothetical protein FD149_1019 [Rhodospirillaceae bacterium]
MELTLTTIDLPEGRLFTAFLRDITDHHRIEQQLRKLSQVIEQSPTAIMITDTEGVIEYVNAQFCASTGYDRDEAVGQTPRLIQSGQTSHETYDAIWHNLLSGREWRGEMLNRRRDGALIWEYATLFPIRDKHGTVVNFVGIKEDLTVHKECEERLLRQTNYDALTGLPNRLLVLDRLHQAIASAKRDNQTGAVLLMDLDHFQAVGHSFGPAVADAIICDSAHRLGSAVRGNDTVARTSIPTGSRPF